MFLCLVMGIYSYNSLGRSEDPSFTIKQMVVSAAWPGATAKEVEEHLTDKIEKQLQTVPNIDRITSCCYQCLSAGYSTGQRNQTALAGIA